ncbi:MAG: hypothetical protein FWH17_05385 [Oscillospiraceae bacterium]|nr:hypothetical protein [Oscillospiraceae bacterium]
MNRTALNKNDTEFMPLLALRGLSVFPNMLLNFDVERAISTGALEAHRIK